MILHTCLTIGGSHPTSQAGIQADLQCSKFWQVPSTSIITTVTAQNSQKFLGQQPVSDRLLKQQINCNIEQFPQPFIKIAMIGSLSHYKVIQSAKKKFAQIICDPIITTTTGQKNIDNCQPLLNFIASCCNVITPNFNEFQKITGIQLDNEKIITDTLQKFAKKYQCQIFLKGGHSSTPSIDYFTNQQQTYRLSLPLLQKIKTSHGTGCKIAMSITNNLALGRNLLEAIINAKAYVYDGLANPQKIHNTWIMGEIKNYKKTTKKIIITQL